MQAVILVGGEGTRLRPLTSTIPKPVVALVDRPMMAYMFEWLHGHGVDDVIMSCGFKATKVRDVLGDGSQYGIRLRFVEEPDPRGTAGALKFAEEFLDERFLMLNGDVLTDLDLSAQIAQHEATGATGTLALVPVPDPSSYGLVRLREDGAVEEFLEKPSPDAVLDTNLISAGAYVLERSVLDLIAPDRNVSIEREIWPRARRPGPLRLRRRRRLLDRRRDARALPAGDLRHPRGQRAHGRRGQARRRLPVDRPVGAGRRARGAARDRRRRLRRSRAGAHVGSLAVLGEDVSIGAGSIVERAVVLDGARVGEDCILRDCIVGPGARIGDRSQIIGGAMVGEGVMIGADNVIARGARLFPGMEVPDGGLAFP